MFQGRDENELRRHIHANSIERHTIRKLLQKVFVPCSCAGVCSKHEVAFSIESTVQTLDISEENISTLLCYLELHSNKYIEVLSPAYTWCKIISYGGPLQIKKVAKVRQTIFYYLVYDFYIKKKFCGKFFKQLYMRILDVLPLIREHFEFQYENQQSQENLIPSSTCHKWLLTTVADSVGCFFFHRRLCIVA